MNEKKLVEETEELLNSNYKEWSKAWNIYADKILSNLEKISELRSTFNEWYPLCIYLPIIDSMQTNPKFIIRFKGQIVAELIVDDNLNPLLKIDDKRAVANKKYFDVIVEPGEYEWRGAEAKKFRLDFKSCMKKQGKSEESMLESLILDEMRMKSQDKFLNTLRDIQPIMLADSLRFQMPTPLSSNTGSPVYTKGNIDIFCRIGKGAGVELGVFELKRNDRSSYKKAAAQSLIYTICIRYILRDERMGWKWWKIFGFERDLPKKITINSVVIIPEELKDLYDKEIIDISNNHYLLGEDKIKYSYILFEHIHKAKEDRLKIIDHNIDRLKN